MTGYILSHWRGEQSLAKSYWINMFFLTLFLLAVINVLVELSETHVASPWQLLSWMISVYSACFAIWIWQAVGCWRAANRRIVSTGRSGWSRFVQTLIVLGVFANISELEGAAQMVREVFSIATRTDDLQDVDISLINGTELAINGYITFDVPAEVRNYLKYNPNIKYIHLNSPGGRIGPARDLRDLIESYALSTYTESGCYSACTIAFMAGISRVLRVGAELGFHQGSMPGMSRAELSAETSIDKRYFMKRGISESFVLKAFGTPNEDLWMPTLSELWSSNSITHILDGDSMVMVEEYCSHVECGHISY